MLYATAVFAPLLGSLVAGLFGRQLGDRASQAVTVLCMVVATFAGVASFLPFLTGEGLPSTVSLGTWIHVESFRVDWALRYDTLAAMMVAMVTFIATLIHIYSIGYMSHDATIPRFFSYLSLFTFAMLMLVTADNLVQLFFGWEGVGLASYLLIGYWYDRPSANKAAWRDPQVAAAYVAAVLAADPGNKYAHFNLGQIAQSNGDFQSAIMQYEASLAADPDYEPALYNSGLAYASAGDQANGVAMLRRALKVNPESARTLFNLGTMLIADGSEEEGAEFVARAIEIDPSLKPAGN